MLNFKLHFYWLWLFNAGLLLLPWIVRYCNGAPDAGFSSSTNFKTSLIQTVNNGREEVGFTIAAKIYESICWFEYLKLYVPKTRSLEFNQCHGQGNFQRDTVLKQRAPEQFFGKFLYEHAMQRLPTEYNVACSPFLLNDERRHGVPLKDYSELLTNSSDKMIREASREGYPFPYKAFVHCMIDVVSRNYKEQGLQLITERLTKDTNWAEAIFLRENQFRLLHRVQPLRINDELTARAQKWANQLARDCQMYHIHSSHPDYRLNGSRMGENLFTGDNIHSPKEDMGLFGTNIWYEEIQYYPWPEYKGYGEDPLFLQFAHFSQMIWKESEMVGYGYAINSSANCGQYFIVSRYFPPGNNYDKFLDNVLPL